MADPLKRRRGYLLAAVGLAVGLAVGGATASFWVKSPQERLAETAAPGLSILTVPVERRVLEDKVITRGTATPARRIEVTASAPEGGSAIVTAVRVKAGDNVKAGAVLIEVAGRPLFAFTGRTPAYRDLRPGSHGADVSQLQAALTDLGYGPGESGTFGPGTKRALTAFYTAKGFEAPQAGDAEALAAASRAVTEATRARDDAAAAPKTGKDAERALTRAEQDLTEAREAYAKLDAATGPMLPFAEAVFLPGFPARVDQVQATLGAAPGVPALVLSAGELAVKAQLSATERELIDTGMTADLAVGDEGVPVKGKVTAIEPGAPDAGQGRGAFIALIEPSGRIDPGLSGQSALVTIRVSSTAGPVLVVPVAAVYATADGAAHVLAVAADGTQARVDVTLGLSSDGYVEVTAPDLTEGVQVRVGVAA